MPTRSNERLCELAQAGDTAARVKERRMTEEFDLLLYFPDGKPDSYYYCLKQEGEHVLYHRFTREDYLSFGFEEEQAETERQ